MTSDPDQRFGWTKFYEEFADKLLEHKDDRSWLVGAVHDTSSILENRGFFQDRFADGSDGPLRDIDPFTTMAIFNRQYSDEVRYNLAARLGSHLGVQEPAPSYFDGIRPLYFVATPLFAWDKDRIPGDIDTLWQVFSDAIAFAEFGDGSTWQAFTGSFDLAMEAVGVGHVNLTRYLSWVRPRRYPNLDRDSRKYMNDRLEIGIPVSPTGEQYIEIADYLLNRFSRSDFPVHSFQEIQQAITVDSPDEETDESIELPTHVDDETFTYTIASIVSDGCFLPKCKLKTILNRLKSKKNLILQGPPGTGKTWLARKLAFALIEQESDYFVRRFQFHPNMSYEDFIRGYRPDGDGRLNLVDGPFLEMVNDAKNDPDNDHVLVIEEINRGNPAQIFGEMLTLLEADKRDPSEALALAHSRPSDERVHIPPNVYVIGTMNVADRSIAMVDLALRRRFAFVDLEPVFGDVWRNWVNEQCGIPLDFLTNIEERITSLNEQIAADRTLGPQFRVGHSYVTPPEDTPIDDPHEWFSQIVETEIGPLLDEYWFDDAQKAESAKSELLAGL